MQIDPNTWQRAILDGMIPNVPQSSTPLHIRDAINAYYQAIDASSYYQSAATESLIPPVDHRVVLLSFTDYLANRQIIIKALVIAAAYLIGWQAGYVVGVLQPWIDARGWIALLFIAIGVPIAGIFYHNKEH